MEGIEKFLLFAESLKLVRKSQVFDVDSDNVTSEIYTDLLPKNGVLNKINLPRTTILVGRKGTGKSTIFHKSQDELSKKKDCISIYIDVKSLFDNSTPSLSEEINPYASEELRKFLIYSNFIKEIVLSVKNKLNDLIDDDFWAKVLGKNDEKDLIRIEIEKIEESINNVFKEIDLSIVKSFKNIQEVTSDHNINGSISIGKDIGAKIGGSVEDSSSLKKEFESTLVKYLDIKTCLIENLSKIKEILGVKYLYIYLDDFSEINFDAQVIFMDWFIAPLNNLSDDFVKFKIATYPNRFYYGKLDNSKIDEVPLDFFDAFYSFERNTNISKMETLALDYTKRLMRKRFEHYFPEDNWSKYFDISEKDLFDLLFSVSFNIPRKIGYILSYCYESCLIHETRITKEAIINASLRYYEDVIVKYFIANIHVSKPFNDKISNEYQFELLKKIIGRQSYNISKTYKTKIVGKPANHFIVNDNLCHLLDNLELNGFITTYNKITDQNGDISNVYSLDYGMCKRFNINFSRASNNTLINYFNQPRFNLNTLITDYFNKTQIIKCQMGHEFPYSMLETLKTIKMKCHECLDHNIVSFCEVVVSNEEIRKKLRSLENAELVSLKAEEYYILDYLKLAKNALSNKKIAASLDNSVKTVSIFITKLIERSLIEIDEEVSKKLHNEHYKITEKGLRMIKKIDFFLNKESDMKIEAEDESQNSGIIDSLKDK